MVRRNRPLLPAQARVSPGVGRCSPGLAPRPPTAWPACRGAAAGGAQDSAAADVTGDFDWKRNDGTTIRVLLNEHPYSDALKARSSRPSRI